jgi:hypothetical protein
MGGYDEPPGKGTLLKRRLLPWLTGGRGALGPPPHLMLAC